MRKKIFLISISIFAIVILSFTLLSSLYPPSSAIERRTLKLGPNEEISHKFRYNGSKNQAHEEIPVNFSVQVTELNSPGVIRVYLNDMFLAYSKIDSSKTLILISVNPPSAWCGCGSILTGKYAPAVIRSENNSIMIKSEDFAGELTYRIDYWNDEASKNFAGNCEI
ncbi:MAG: hypothetical protein NWE86_05120 [Candidatus Bathyarchaeota archaeon]|nr:hypothetical protein [Candidatus Bathyarchaeota archaeon]